jgi:hypothetical protein
MNRIIALLVGVFIVSNSFSQYHTVNHRKITENEIAIKTAGSYAEAGKTYVLENDVSSSRSSIFLGKDVTLDLNGFTITFADTCYEHIPNFSFEEGLKDWDISKAPGAKIEDTKIHVFAGDKILRLSKGEEIVSEYIDLPVPGRSYVAMCGVTTLDMIVSVYVEDEQGHSVVCNTTYRNEVKQSCPIENRSPQLGGGFVFAHLTGMKAGKYRVRVKAETDCLIDHVDIRPSMDVGVGIVENTDAMGHNDHLYKREHCAFFDYTANASQSKPLEGIPVVTGKGTVTIKNGIIKNGTLGAISWGIQSTANEVMVILDNVNIMNSGINATAADLLQATITNCTFEVKNPFIINRHGSEFYGVDLRGDKSSEVSYNEFYGGQGCLAFKGNFSKVHHNLFVNRQTVTNHYSIMAMGDSSLVFDNVIKPEIGSGIEVFRHKGIEIFNNEIHIQAAPPSCEYGHEEYSTTALRIADYGAKPGSPDGCYGNKVYNNKIYVTGKDYPEYPDYIPMAWAVFYSASAGDNYFFGNEIQLNELTPGAKNVTSGFYIGGGTIGGHFFHNRITTNVPAAWVASRYGGAESTVLSNNTIIKSSNAGESFKPFRMGWKGRTDCVAKNIEFRSNEIAGQKFEMDITDQDHSYAVYWTLNILITNAKGTPSKNVDVTILDKNNTVALKSKTDSNGRLSVELQEYSVDSKEKKVLSPYTITVGNFKKVIELNSNKEIVIP